jgi:hypothetical protein
MRFEQYNNKDDLLVEYRMLYPTVRGYILYSTQISTDDRILY